MKVLPESLPTRTPGRSCHTEICVLLVVLVAIEFVILPATATAQTSSSAVLQGTVTAADGSAVPRAHIELMHGPTGAVRRVAAGDDGRYCVTGLPVGGPYTLKVSHIGFAVYLRSGLYLRLLERTVANVALKQVDLKGEEVVVTGNRIDLPYEKSQGASFQADRRHLESLPMPTGSLEDTYRLSPYMTGQNALGLNASYNDVSLDGIGIADQYGLQDRETIPGSMRASLISLESLQEVRVDVAPFDVRRSGFTGASVAAVSRSGSNVFDGSAYAEGAGGRLLGKNPDDGRTDLRSYADGRAGFRIGGPIVQSRAFFFVAGEFSALRLPVERRFDASVTKGTTYSFPSAVVAQMQTSLDTAYGYEGNRMDAVTLDRKSATVFARFDVNIRRGHRFSVRYSFLDSDTDRPPYGTSVYADGTIALNSTRVHSVFSELNSILTPKISNELLVGYTSRHFESAPQGEPFPFVDVIVLDRFRWWNHLTAGSEVGGDGERLLQKHVEVHDNLSIASNDHLMTVGVQGDLHWFNSRLMSSGWGRYAFSSVSAFLQGKPSGYEYRYSIDPAHNDGVDWRALQLGAFLQDEWRASPAVTMSLGIRVDLPVFPDHPRENPAVREVFLPLGYDIATSSVPATRAMFSPRAGFSAYFKDDRSVHVRGGVGLFTGRIPYAWIGNQYDHTGIDNRHVKVSANAPKFVANPMNLPSPGNDSTLLEATEIVVVDRGFVLPQEVRWSIGMDFSFPGKMLLTFEGVYSRTLNGVQFKNINLKPAGNLNPANAGSDRPMYGSSLTDAQWVYSRNDSRFTDVIVMSNGSAGSSSFLTVQLQRQPDNEGTFASLAYSFGDTRDLNSGNWDNAYDQWRYNPAERPNEPRLDCSAFNRAHRIAAGMSYRHQWSDACATTLGIVYTGFSGTPFSYVYDGDLNGDGESLNDLFYVPTNGNEILLINEDNDLTIPSDPKYNELFNYIMHDEYLSMHRGQVTERNGARAPWTHQLDMRLAHTVPLGRIGNLEVHAELLNVLNLIDGSWGLVQYVPYQIVPILQFYKLDVRGRPWFRWAPRTTPLVSDPLLSRWRLKFGIRYSF